MRWYVCVCSWLISVISFLSLPGCSEVQSGTSGIAPLALAAAEEVSSTAKPAKRAQVERKAAIEQNESEEPELNAAEAEPPVKVARSTKTEKSVETDEPAEKPEESKSSAPSTIQLPQQKAAKKPLDPNPTRPVVLLSDAHEKTCRKLVGDTIDPIEVTDIHGTSHRLNELLSDKLTVLIFWNEKSIPAMEQFRRIPVDVLGTFASYRVKVIAANVGGKVPQTRILTGDAADKIVSLVDEDSKLFHQFAESRVPRSYVLDKDGRILWFDIEYSQSTVRSLANALTFHLTKKM